MSDTARKPIGDARVYVVGDSPTSSLTSLEGVIRFTDVNPGIYKIRVAKRGFTDVAIDDVEVFAGRKRIVEVTLARLLTIIGTVKARPTYASSTIDIDQDSPMRRISENLADALDKLAGVSVARDSSGNTLTVSLNGSTSTLAKFGGANLGGAQSGALQAVAAELATGVNTDSGNITAVGGAVNYRSLQPTKTWQEQVSASYGNYEHSNAQFSITGSSGKLGIAAQHAVRGQGSALTGLTFGDASGQTYRHDGSSDKIADFATLRYSVGPNFSLTGQVLNGTLRSNPICDKFVTIVPCGYGPDALTASAVQLRSLSLRGQIGNVTINATAVTSSVSSTTNEPHLSLDGSLSPISLGSITHGISFSDSSTLAIGRQTISSNLGFAKSTGKQTNSGKFGGSGPLLYRFAYASVGDEYKISDRWSFMVGGGINQNILTTVAATDAALTLAPTNRESLSLGAGFYAGGSFYQPSTLIGDPVTANYDCETGIVTVVAPPTAPTSGSQRSAYVSYSRRGARGSLRLYAYARTDHGTGENAIGLLSGVDPSLVPPTYLSALYAIWHRPTVCGETSFDQKKVFASQFVTGLNEISRGLNASGQLAVGKNTIVQGSYSIDASVLQTADPRLVRFGSPYSVGSQLPFHPLNKGSLLVDVVQPRYHLEWVANASWQSSNNSAGLGAYTVVSAGVSRASARGRLSLFSNNLFNVETGTFATNKFAVGVPLNGGGTYSPIPTTLPPRSITLLYSLRAGRQK